MCGKALSLVKIAILAHLKYPIAQPFAGGLERHTHLLASQLIKRGHSVTLFAARGSDPDIGTVDICDPTGDDCERIVETNAYRTVMARVAMGGFDLVHNNALHDLPLRESRTLAPPMVCVLHTPPFQPYAAAMRACAPEMPLIGVSRSLADEWAEIAPDVQVVENGIDVQAFPFAPHPVTPAYAFWSGRIVPEKGLHLAIEAARLAGMPLAFAGPRHPGSYWQTAIAPRLGQDVTDLGHLSQPDLARWLGGAQVALVSPCWEEPFGLVVAEALACGTPVAAFGRGALPTILDGATGRLAAPDDARDLARAAREAMRLDRSACRRRAEALFDVERMIDAYEDIYGRLVASRDSPAASWRLPALASA